MKSRSRTHADETATLVRQGLADHRAGRIHEAEAAYRRVLAGDSDHAEALHLLGLLLHQRGEHARAGALLERAVALAPRDAEVIFHLGLVLEALQRLDEAAACFERAVALDPRNTGALNRLGIALNAQGRSHEAVARLEQALALRPDYVEAHVNLGNARQAQGRLDEAIASYERALAARPRYARAHVNLGAALHARGRLREAAAHLERALAVRPDHAEAHNNLGNVLQAAGRTDEAIACYERALAARPDFAKAHYNLGTVLHARARLSEARAHLERALASSPDYPDAHHNLGLVLQAEGRLDEAVSHLERALALRPDLASAHSNLLFCLNHLPHLGLARLYEAHREWAERHAARLPQRRPATPPADPDKRLRIGYLSPDFRAHSVGYLIEPVLAAHDRTKCEIYCYTTTAAVDEQTGRLRGLADAWREIAALGDEEAAKVVAEDRIDILVDLAGHTAGNRLLVLARKPAPVQATWLGYANTTGLEAIDCLLADEVAVPAQSAQRFVESVVRLPGTLLCCPSSRELPAIAPPPVLRTRHVTFGSFNEHAKVTPDVVAAWAGILHALPASRLLLKSNALADAEVRARLAEAFGAHGIDPARLDLRGRVSSKAEHLALYGEVDLALDTFPYNGATTTCEALLMGVPVVTLAGDRLVSRTAASVLTCIGLEALVAGSVEEYVETGVGFAGDPERLAELRAGMRERIRVTPLGDPTVFTANLERAYRAMWARWCEARNGAICVADRGGQGRG